LPKFERAFTIYQTHPSHINFETNYVSNIIFLFQVLNTNFIQNLVSQTCLLTPQLTITDRLKKSLIVSYETDLDNWPKKSFTSVDTGKFILFTYFINNNLHIQRQNKITLHFVIRFNNEKKVGYHWTRWSSLHVYSCS
jgi:hypothetical protein